MKIFVTGGSRGIGKSIVNKFLSENHTVDFIDSKSFDLKTIKTFPNLEYDVLINNAGINDILSIENIVDFDDIISVNFTSAVRIFQSILPYMKQNNFGRIVNIGSIWIDFAKPERFLYSASKKALHALTEHITAEYSNFNILANTVSPGYVETDMTYKNNTDQDIRAITQKIPINRLAKPEEIADLVYFLSVNNSYISGQNIIIDGGYSCTAK
jgi:3-oxoacyl-[acyl-carrier protein] reductase